MLNSESNLFCTDLGTPMGNFILRCYLGTIHNFWSNLTQSFKDGPIHCVLNPQKFELNWTKIVDFSLMVLKVEISHWGAQVSKPNAYN